MKKNRAEKISRVFENLKNFLLEILKPIIMSLLLFLNLIFRQDDPVKHWEPKIPNIEQENDEIDICIQNPGMEQCVNKNLIQNSN